MSAGVDTTTAPRPAAWELQSPAAIADTSSRLFDYVLLRVTGVVLSVLVLGHFAVTHFVTDVAHDDAAFVARRLTAGLWITWDTTMLAAALAHGCVGVRLALADYASRRNRLLGRAVVGVATVLLVLGAIAIGRAAHV